MTLDYETFDRAYRAARTQARLSRDEEADLVLRSHDGDEEALDELVRRHAWIVYWTITELVDPAGFGGALELMDLVQEGHLGLLRGIRRFVPGYGQRLSTLTAITVHQDISKLLDRNMASGVRLPHDPARLLRKLHRHSERLMQEIERDPTPADLAEFAGMDEDVLLRLEGAAGEPTRLDLPVDRDCDDSPPLIETLADEAALSPFLAAHYRDLYDAIAELPQRQQEVLRRLYALGSDDTRTETLDEIGAALGISRQRVHQIRNQALDRLKRRLT